MNFINEDEFKNSFFTINSAQVFGIIVVYFIANLLIGGIISLVDTYVFPLYHNDNYNWVMPISWLIPFIMMLLYYKDMLLKKQGLQKMFDVTTIHFSDLLLVIPAFMGMAWLSEYLASFIPTEGNEFIEQMYESMMEVYYYLDTYPIASIITITILAPIFEELVFRGVILRGLLNKGMKPIVAVFISALIFGCIHIFPWQVVGATLLGALIGWVYYKTSSLLICMLLHFLNNGITAWLYYTYGNVNSDDILPIYNWGLALIGFGVLVVCMFIFNRITQKRQWKLY